MIERLVYGGRKKCIGHFVHFLLDILALIGVHALTMLIVSIERQQSSHVQFLSVFKQSR